MCARVRVIMTCVLYFQCDFIWALAMCVHWMAVYFLTFFDQEIPLHIFLTFQFVKTEGMLSGKILRLL